MTFKHTPLKDAPEESVLPFEYLWPDQLVKSVVDFDEVIAKWPGSMTDAQKRAALKGKAIVSVGQLKTIRYHVFFAPTRELWDEVSKENGLARTLANGDEESLYQGGIFTSSRGMPTGVDPLEPPRGYSSGYWPNFRMLLEHDGITFDLGRKSLGNYQAVFTKVAKELFDRIWPYYKFTSTNPAIFPTGVAQLEKKTTFEELRKRPDLPIAGLDFVKHPSDQEAAVVAIFHDLLGKGLLRGYRTLGMGYRETYDSWGTYTIDRATSGAKYKPYHGKELDVVIEFKYVGEDFVRDVEQDVKQYELVDLVVCWDFDAQKIAQRGFIVSPIPAEDVQSHGSNYRVTPPGGGAGAIDKPMLVLRQFLDQLAGAKANP